MKVTDLSGSVSVCWRASHIMPRRCSSVCVESTAIRMSTSFLSVLVACRSSCARTYDHSLLRCRVNETRCWREHQRTNRESCFRSSRVMVIREVILYGQREEIAGENVVAMTKNPHAETTAVVRYPMVLYTSIVNKQSPMRKKQSDSWSSIGKVAAISKTFQSRRAGFRKCRTRRRTCGDV